MISTSSEYILNTIPKSYMSTQKKTHGKSMRRITGMLKYSKVDRRIKADRFSTFINRVKSIFLGKDYFQKKINKSIRQALNAMIHDHIDDSRIYDDRSNNREYLKTADHKLYREYALKRIVHDLEEIYMQEINKAHPTDRVSYKKELRHLMYMEELKTAVETLKHHITDSGKSVTFDSLIHEALKKSKQALGIPDKEREGIGVIGFAQVDPKVRDIQVLQKNGSMRPVRDILQDLEKARIDITRGELKNIEEDYNYLFLMGKTLIAAEFLHVSNEEMNEIKHGFESIHSKRLHDYEYEKYKRIAGSLHMRPVRLVYNDQKKAAYVDYGDGKRSRFWIKYPADYERLIVFYDYLNPENDIKIQTEFGKKELFPSERANLVALQSSMTNYKYNDPYSLELFRKNFKMFKNMMQIHGVSDDNAWIEAVDAQNRLVELQSKRTPAVVHNVAQNYASEDIIEDTEKDIGQFLNDRSGLFAKFVAQWVRFADKTLDPIYDSLSKYAEYVYSRKDVNRYDPNFITWKILTDKNYMKEISESDPLLSKALLSYLDGKIEYNVLFQELQKLSGMKDAKDTANAVAAEAANLKELGEIRSLKDLITDENIPEIKLIDQNKADAVSEEAHEISELREDQEVASTSEPQSDKKMKRFSGIRSSMKKAKKATKGAAKGATKTFRSIATNVEDLALNIKDNFKRDTKVRSTIGADVKREKTIFGSKKKKVAFENTMNRSMSSDELFSRDMDVSKPKTKKAKSQFTITKKVLTVPKFKKKTQEIREAPKMQEQPKENVIKVNKPIFRVRQKMTEAEVLRRDLGENNPFAVSEGESKSQKRTAPAGPNPFEESTNPFEGLADEENEEDWVDDESNPFSSHNMSEKAEAVSNTSKASVIEKSEKEEQPVSKATETRVFNDETAASNIKREKSTDSLSSLLSNASGIVLDAEDSSQKFQERAIDVPEEMITPPVPPKTSEAKSPTISRSSMSRQSAPVTRNKSEMKVTKTPEQARFERTYSVEDLRKKSAPKPRRIRPIKNLTKLIRKTRSK